MTIREFGSRLRGLPVIAMNSFPFDPDAKYTLRKGSHPELVEEEIDLLQRASGVVDRQVGLDATPEERIAAAKELFAEGGELAALGERLQVLSESHSASVLKALASLAEDELEADDPIRAAERAFEEHEAELVTRLMALGEENIPEGATVREAIASMQRTYREDPEAQELIGRLLTMQHFGGGAAVAALTKQRRNPPPESM